MENQHRTRWLIGVPTGPGLRWEFRRGFPERLEGETQFVLNHYKKIRLVPWLRDLCLTCFSGDAARVFTTRIWPPMLVELEIWPPGHPRWGIGIDDSRFAARTIATCPGLSQLRVLRMGGDPLAAGAVAALADSLHLEEIERLIVPGDTALPVYAPLRARFGERLIGEGA